VVWKGRKNNQFTDTKNAFKGVENQRTELEKTAGKP
jgi:hypothetical protein